MQNAYHLVKSDYASSAAVLIQDDNDPSRLKIRCQDMLTRTIPLFLALMKAETNIEETWVCIVLECLHALASALLSASEAMLGRYVCQSHLAGITQTHTLVWQRRRQLSQPISDRGSSNSTFQDWETCKDSLPSVAEREFVASAPNHVYTTGFGFWSASQHLEKVPASVSTTLSIFGHHRIRTRKTYSRIQSQPPRIWSAVSHGVHAGKRNTSSERKAQKGSCDC